MMKSKLFYLISLVSFTQIICQESQETFHVQFESAGVDRGVSVATLRDGDYIVIGYTSKVGTEDEDVLLIHTNKKGQIVWKREFGGMGTDNGWTVFPLPDKDYLISGYTNSQGAGGMDVYLIRTDALGNTIWTKTLGGTGDEYSWDIRKTKDNNFIIAAQTNSLGKGDIDAYLIKIDAAGNELWSKTYGGEQVDRIFSVRQTPDDGYVAVGITYSFGAGDRDAYLLKTDNTGELEWFKTFGGPAFDVGHSVALTEDGGYLVTGYGESFSKNGGRDVYLVKTDDQGEIQWKKVYGGSQNDRAMKGMQTKDGGYIAIGFTQGLTSVHMDWDVLLLKTDAAGDLQWSRTFGDRDHHDIGYTVAETTDGGYILTGNSQNLINGISKILLIKTNGQGKLKP